MNREEPRRERKLLVGLHKHIGSSPPDTPPILVGNYIFWSFPGKGMPPHAYIYVHKCNPLPNSGVKVTSVKCIQKPNPCSSKHNWVVEKRLYFLPDRREFRLPSLGTSFPPSLQLSLCLSLSLSPWTQWIPNEVSTRALKVKCWGHEPNAFSTWSPRVGSMCR